ncbi:hypothetical protein KVR01_011341 [Diaporthe batatas]|uniref:uncharacterized protein n=1 Tax=Diaporthe batatas TaxID=748121 RepID=UPI001D03C030|nr:uncharacterized protein KVR01_011341 [Diaporthe batatas]KAG8158898.1 hypothetical protein KVR01_011341 [Diaporthe batatas]
MGSTQPSSRVISSERVFPATAAPTDQPTVTRLSIIDASVARFAACGAVWLYNPTQASHDSTLHNSRLRQALRETLDDYRHFAGQLRWATRDDVQPGDPNPRHVGRPLVSYGSPAADPGVELVCAEYDRPLLGVVPSPEDRRAAQKTWHATGFPQDELLPRRRLAFTASLADFEGLPGVAVQITRFACGGWAVGVVMSHCLADAVCLLGFVHAWAARSRALVAGGGLTEPTGSTPPRPVFEPALLDQHAGLTGASTEPDPEKVALARSLPMHRYDWWATEAPGYPAWATASSDATRPPDQPGGVVTRLSPSTFPPWPTWDMAAPVEHVQIRFGAGEVARIRRAAQGDNGGEGEQEEEEKEKPPAISRLDALLAHMWILINRARGLHAAAETVYLDVTLGLRARVSPPLPGSFAGSPILLGHVARRGRDVCSSSSPSSSAAGARARAGVPLGAIAVGIRRMMALFTPEAVAAYIHDAAHEVSPQRLWQAFVGGQHTLVTSWVRAGAYEVDFCGDGGGGGGECDGGTRPVYVQGKMPRMDGLLQVMDLADGTGDFDVSLCLEKGAMGRLLGDEMLRMYEV